MENPVTLPLRTKPRTYLVNPVNLPLGTKPHTYLVNVLAPRRAHFSQIFTELLVLCYASPGAGQLLQPDLDLFLECVNEVVVLLLLSLALFVVGLPLALWKDKNDNNDAFCPACYIAVFKICTYGIIYVFRFLA